MVHWNPEYQRNHTLIMQSAHFYSLQPVRNWLRKVLINQQTGSLWLDWLVAPLPTWFKARANLEPLHHGIVHRRRLISRTMVLTVHPLPKWHTKIEAAPFAQFTLSPNLPLMSFHNLLDEGQAQATTIIISLAWWVFPNLIHSFPPVIPPPSWGQAPPPSSWG